MPSSCRHITIRFRQSALALACALVCAPGAMAQPMPELVRPEADSHVLPIWNVQSGKMEALLLLSSEHEQASLLDRVFPRERTLPGAALNINLGDAGQLRTALQPDMSTGLALLCSQGIHMAMSLGTLGQQCLLAQVGNSTDPLMLPSSGSPGASLDMRWKNTQGNLDMSFGLSWLNTSLHPENLDFQSLSPTHASYTPNLPQLAPLALGDLHLRQVRWNSHLTLGPQTRLSLGATLGSNELAALDGQSQRWDSTTITLGVGYRNLSGQLTGRLIELPQGQGSFSGVDLGFSWRTSWQGELSVGAKNLLNQKPDTSQWPLSDLPALEIPGGRTPYVRYKQDL